jgi:hypothetical protein
MGALTMRCSAVLVVMVHVILQLTPTYPDFLNPNQPWPANARMMTNVQKDLNV